MVKNIVRNRREKLGYTQADLAEQTNLSIRTIQRVESGNTIPKGHTLKVLSEALEIGKEELLSPQQDFSEEELDARCNLKLKQINLCALFFIGIPLGNIFIPYIMWEKNNHLEEVDEVGRRIINFQIIWTVATYMLLIISPFLQDYVPSNITLILVVGLVMMIINLIVIVKTATSLNAYQYDVLDLKIRLL